MQEAPQLPEPGASDTAALELSSSSRRGLAGAAARRFVATQEAPQLPETGASDTAAREQSTSSGRSLAGTAWGSIRFSSSFRRGRPYPLPGPNRSQNSANSMVAQYGKGQRDDSSRSRAAAETGRHDWTQQVTVSMSPSNSLTTSGRRPMAAALPKGSGFPRPYPSIGGDDDPGTTAGDGNASNDKGIEGLLAKVPPTVWQPNAVVRLHRRKANLYWALLLLGYITYIIFAISDALERRKSPPVKLTLINKPFQLPDVGFCFEGDTYGSRFGCFDGDADGKACTDSLIGDAFVYGYNQTGYTTPAGYGNPDEYVVLLPETLSDTCTGFRLSSLTAKESEVAAAWRFHMLMFWNSSYNSTANAGAFESIKMYLYQGGLTAEEVVNTPITLYPPISFDPAEVPFVRGFLEYEQQVLLSEEEIHTYKVVDTTTTPWHNAEDATALAADYGTDTLASIQLDVRTQSFYQYSEVDPLDIVGTLGEISGFWLVVPLLFGLLFYRPESGGDDQSEMRSFSVCTRRRTATVAPPAATRSADRGRERVIHPMVRHGPEF